MVAILKAWEIVSGRKLVNIPASSLSRFLSTTMSKVSLLPAAFRDFGLGLVTVLLPCMTLTPALAAAAGSGSSLKGLLYMTAFALGTVPIMIGATYMPVVIYRRVPESMARWLVVLFLLIAGVITFIRH